MYKLILVALLALFSQASEWTIQEGVIQAHTEVFGDSDINPATTQISSQLHHDDSGLESLRGEVKLDSMSLKSDTPKRDLNMYELLNTAVHPTITFDMINVVKNDENYTIEGYLTLNGIKKKITSQAVVEQNNSELKLNGAFDILLTDFGMEPPTLLFLTVRNKIDIDYTLSYTKEP